MAARQRLTRTARAALTRSDLLEAAERRFFRDGYHRTTVEAIAEDAGYSTGAVYSAFDGKAGLFLALADAIIERRLAEMVDLFEQQRSGPALLLALAERPVDERNEQWSLLAIEFCVHAARDPALLERFAVRYRRARAGLAAAGQRGHSARRRRLGPRRRWP